MPADDFDARFVAIDSIGGWLTRDQARTLDRAVAALPDGPVVVEVGSHQGRSTVVLAQARPDVTVVAIDPFVDGWKFGGARTRQVFEHNLDRHGVADRVRLLTSPSDEVRNDWDGRIDLVYVDGKHDALSTTHDLRWARFLDPGGRIFVHDAFSSIGVTLALLASVLPGRHLSYVGRTGSLAEFVVRRPRATDRLAMLRELPWWLRNVGIKVLLRVGARRTAARFGHHDRWDSY